MKAAARATNRRGRDVLKNYSAQKGRKSVLPKEYQAIFKNTGKPMVIVEEDATISLANDEFEKLSGYKREEIEGKKSWTEFVARNDRKRVKEYHHLRRSDPMLAPRCFEFRFLDRHGKIKNIVLTIGTIPGTKKSMASLLDVTDRRRAEASVRASEERYHTLFENSRDAFYITTRDGAYIDANQAALDLFGYTKEQMRKVNARQLYADPADAQRFQQEIEKKGFVRDFEVKLRNRNGTKIDCLFTVTAQQADDGGILEYQGIVRDITERKRMEEALKESEERYRTLVENVDFGINLIDTDHKVIMTNAALGRQFNKPVSEMIGKKCFREFEKRDAVCPHCPGEQAMATGKSAEVETQGVKDDGSRYHARVQAFPAFGHDGTMTGFIEVVEDITERKKTEELLQQEKETFYTILQNALYGVALMSSDGKHVYVNPEFTAITGYTLEDIPTGRDWMHKAYPDKAYRQEVTKCWREDSKLGGTRRVISIVCKDGETKEIETSRTPLENGLSVVMLTDITERKRAEQALQKSQEELQTIMDASPIGISWADMQGNIQYNNRKHHELFGYTLDDIPTIAEWRRQAYQDSVQREKLGSWQNGIKKAQKHGGSFPPQEMTITCKDGSIRHVTLMRKLVSDRMLAIYSDITERKQMEDELRESEDRFKMLAEHAPLGISIMAPDRSFEYLNPRFTEIFGYTTEDIPDKDTWFEKAYPDKAYRKKVISTWKRDITKAVKIGDENPRVFTVRCKDGQDKIIDFRSVDLKDGKQYLVYEDITARAKAEESLRESEERYRTLVENVDFGINLIDADHTIVMVNAEQSKRLYKPVSALIGEKCFREFEKRDAVCPHCPAVQTLATGQPAEAETEAVRDDGSRFHVRIQTFPVYGHDHTIAGFIEIVEDITERKRAEQALQKSQEELQTLMDASPVAIAWADLQGNIQYINRKHHELFGYPLEDIPTIDEWRRQADQDPAQRKKFAHWQEELLEAHRDGRSFPPLEMAVTCKDGSIRYVMVEGTVAANRSLSIFNDITERKRAEQALQKSQEELQTLMDASPVAISWADLQGNIQYINRKHHELFGYPLEDIPTIDEWRRQADQDPAQRERFAQWGEELMEAHKQDRSLPPREMTVNCKDGSIRYVTIEGTIVSNHNMVIYNDITERKQMEGELRESESRFRLLVEHSKDTLLLHDFEGKIIDVNQHACESLGYTREELLGLSIQDIDDDVLPGKHKEKWKQMVGGEPITLEGVHRRKDGTTFPVEVRLGVLESGGRKLMLGLVRDVTERKRAEERLKRYAAELERSNEEVKNFAYIVSHDLRVPLVNLKGYTSELHSALEVVGPAMETTLPHLNEDKRSAVAMALHEDVPEALEFITNSVSRMDSFINSVLILSRLGRRELKPEPIDMNALFQTSLESLSHQIQERGTAVAIGSLPQVVADRTAMEQIVGNILGNAVKYLDPERTGQIEVTAQTNNGEQFFLIRDNGRGIAQEDMHKVFAPFRRAGKQDTQGEGMGLAYVQTLIRRHNGRIWCESELGKGTTFTFSISQQRAEGKDYVSH